MWLEIFISKQYQTYRQPCVVDARQNQYSGVYLNFSPKPDRRKFSLFSDLPFFEEMVLHPYNYNSYYAEDNETPKMFVPIICY